MVFLVPPLRKLPIRFLLQGVRFNCLPRISVAGRFIAAGLFWTYARTAATSFCRFSCKGTVALRFLAQPLSSLHHARQLAGVHTGRAEQRANTTL